MARTVKPTVAELSKAMRTRGRGKAPERHIASDNHDVREPQGGYAHEGKLDNPYPSAEEIKTLDLGGVYRTGETPAAIMYGRRQVVLSHMLAATPVSEIVRMCEADFGMSATMTRYIMRDIRIAWRADIEEGSAYAKQEAITRLRRDLASMRAASPKPWRDIRGHENLLAKIEGTMAPIRVNVYDVNEVMRDALAGVLGGMGADEIAEYMGRGYEQAGGAGSVIDVVGE
jgi:hypothetical protein